MADPSLQHCPPGKAADRRVDLLNFKEVLTESSEDRIRISADPEAIGVDLVGCVEKDSFPRPLLVTPGPLIQLVRLLEAGRSILLVGESGTGKERLLWQLAVAIARQPSGFPPSLTGRRLYLVNPTAFQEGVLYMHEFETKMRTLAADLLHRRAILAIDHGWLLVSAGARTEHDSRTAANLLVTWMDRGLQLVVLALPSWSDWMRVQNAPFVSRLTPLRLEPWGEPETVHLIRLLAAPRAGDARLEREAVTVARLFLKGPLPGSAARLVEEAAACSSNPESLTLDDLYLAAHRRTGLRLDVLDPRVPLPHEEVRRALQEAIYGQEEAVDAVADAVVALKARLIPEGAPLAVVLFVGPTGVGKTELAKQLAAFLFGSPVRLLSWDMGTHVGPEGLRRFLGSGEYPSQLDQAAARGPMVVLFDEIDQTDVYLLDALLSVLGEGRIGNRRGEIVSFAGSVFVLTSNVGTELFRQRHLGFLKDLPQAALTRAVVGRLEQHFRPEFLNRIHRIVVFKPLTADSIRRIASREIDRVRATINRHFPDIRIEVQDDVLQRCVAEGFDPTYGARPMQRAVDRLVAKPLARHLAAHPGCYGLLKLVLGSQGPLAVHPSSATDVSTARL